MKRKRSDAGGLTSITVLKLKLSLDKEQSDELHHLSSLCRRGQNAGVVNWLLRQHGMPETQKQSERQCVHVKHAGKEKSESSKVYHAVREASIGLTATMHSMLANQVNSHLSAKVDWRRGKNEDGKTPRRKDAIVAYEDRPPFFRAEEIPVRANEAKFQFTDTATLDCRISASERTVLKVKTASLGAGYKAILHDLASGKRKLADSRLIFRKDEWYWFVPVAFEATPIVSDREAVLWPVLGDDQDAKYDRPYRLCLPDDRQRSIGDGRHLVAQTKRIELVKKMIGYRYRNGEGTGHGRSKVDSKKSNLSKHLADIVNEVRRRMIREIVDRCVSSGCGKLLYRQPSLPLREATWFAKAGLTWDWTRFVNDLKNSCAKQGVQLNVADLRWKDVKDAKAKQEAA